jgi:hypothetical protein
MQASSRRAITAAILVVYIAAIALWAGGLVTLGAIVAPTVFGIVPAPSSADAMTVVFRRFDMIAMTCAVLTLISEALLAWRGGKSTRVDSVRALAVVVASGLAILEGTYLSPAIQALHRDGAIRGLNEGGVALERLHKFAETTAKAELILLVVVLLLIVTRSTRPQIDR